MRILYFLTGTSVSFASLASAVVDSYHGQYPNDCPVDCAAVGRDPANWSRLHHLRELKSCDQPIIFDLNVQGLVDDPETIISIRACTSQTLPSSNSSLPAPQIVQQSNIASLQQAPLASEGCGTLTAKYQVTSELGIRSRTHISSSPPSLDDVALAIKQIISYFNNDARCGTSLIFSKVSSAVVGVYSGAQVSKSSAAIMTDAFRGYFQQGSTSLQVCSPNNASFTFGAYASASVDIAETQEAVKSWTNGLCLNATSRMSTDRASLEVHLLVPTLISDSNSTAVSNQNTTSLVRRSSLQGRGDCDAKQVEAGNDCGVLADRCHIPGNDIYKYNPQPNFCSTLKPGQWYCCSSGSLPDKVPRPDKDGNCYAYPVGTGDSCSGIAISFGITEDDIMNFNKNTWGWSGCGPTHLQAHQIICLSQGEPPMPQQLPDVTCGPQVMGTKKQPGVKLADLNPCPLNACCDVWGYCGTTAEFCTPTPADTGAPGTAQPNTNGCISNCGTDLVNNGAAPGSFIKLGYYEAFNYNRACLHMKPQDIPTGYSHIHFAFGTVTKDFAVDISTVSAQFSHFKQISGFKKVLSFGGWDFSTGPDTFQRFRDATRPENRVTFVNNLINFMNEHNIDGFDFDWEYPGAPDIPDVPPGGADEGDNYLGFISLLRGRIAGGKTLSIALPASFWYLRPYNVKEMAKYLDYFVYMTYDLHGQWDVSNKWAIPSCEGGNCLRSHVNKTETFNALVMLTKAGVSSTKIVVGVTSYGRSFRMADEHCSGPFCTFLGARNDSRAYKGRCTATAGYISNAELNEIIANHGSYAIVQSSVDQQSDSNILMYGNPGAVDWVAYMDAGVKQGRIDWIKSLNFGGTTDWAIDLETFIGDDQNPGTVGDDDGYTDDDWVDENDNSPSGCEFSKSPGSLQGLADQADSIEPDCLAEFTLDVFSNDIDESLNMFDKNSQGYDDKFGYYVQWVKDTMNDKLRDFIEPDGGEGFQYFDCTWDSDQGSGSGSCSGMPHLWQFQDSSYSIRYNLRDHNGFFSALESKFGIQEDWIQFGDITNEYGCENIDPGIAGDSGRPGRSSGGTRACQKVKHLLLNVPRKKDDKDITVGNPKDVIEKAWANITALQGEIIADQISLVLGTYGAEEDWYSLLDPIQAYSMPVLQLRSAVESMKTIKDIGENAIQIQRKNLIMEILSIIFMVIPFVGEGMGAVVGGAAAIGRIFTLVAEGANIGTTVADIVADPESAPFAIMGLLLGPAGLGGGGRLSRIEEIEGASSARGLIKSTDIGKYPKSFKERDGQVQKILKGCR